MRDRGYVPIAEFAWAMQPRTPGVARVAAPTFAVYLAPGRGRRTAQRRADRPGHHGHQCRAAHGHPQPVSTQPSGVAVTRGVRNPSASPAPSEAPSDEPESPAASPRNSRPHAPPGFPLLTRAATPARVGIESVGIESVGAAAPPPQPAGPPRGRGGPLVTRWVRRTSRPAGRRKWSSTTLRSTLRLAVSLLFSSGQVAARGS